MVTRFIRELPNPLRQPLCADPFRQQSPRMSESAMEKPLLNGEPLLSTAALARWLGVSTRAVCLWAECREIHAIKIGRQWRFRQDEIRDWLQSPASGKVKNDPVRVRAAAGG